MSSKETEIRFADLFAMLLKAFVPIICIMLIVGMLGSAYAVYSVLNRKPTVTEEDLKTAEDEISNAEAKIKKAERALRQRNEVAIPDAEKKIVTANQLIKRRQEYIDESLYQKLDPFNCGVSRLVFYVKTDFEVVPEVAGLVEDPRDSIALAYAKIYPYDDAILEQILQIMNVKADKRYVQELLSISTSSNRFVEIRVYNNDAEIAKKVVECLYENMKTRLQGIVADYSPIIISTFTGYEVNWSLNDNQLENEDSLISAQRALESAQESLETLQEGVADKEKDVEDAKAAYNEAVSNLESLRKEYANTVPSMRNVLRSAVKYGVIGLVAGLVLGCLLILARNLFNGKLHNQTEVKTRYSFPLLGVLPRTKKLLFEKTIRKLEGESLGSYESEARATAQSILSRIGERSVCLISSQGAAIAEKLSDFTNDKTPVLGSILSDADAVKALADYDGVVLVEQKGTSRLSDIDSEVLRMKTLDKEILGIVLL